MGRDINLRNMEAKQRSLGNWPRAHCFGIGKILHQSWCRDHCELQVENKINWVDCASERGIEASISVNR